MKAQRCGGEARKVKVAVVDEGRKKPGYRIDQDQISYSVWACLGKVFRAGDGRPLQDQCTSQHLLIQSALVIFCLLPSCTSTKDDRKLSGIVALD